MSQVGVACLISLYKGDNAEHFRSALLSVRSQSVSDFVVIVVIDGPIGQSLEDVLEEFPEVIKYRLHKNVGRGLALQSAILEYDYPWIALMDADDICRSVRFEKQLMFLRNNPRCVLLGSSVEEFMETPGDLGRFRVVPGNTAEIVKYARLRNPFNQMTVIFNRRAVLSVGGYRDAKNFEDFDLFLRVLDVGFDVANLRDVLVDARVGNDMIARRSGFWYAAREVSCLWRLRQEGVISIANFLLFIFTRFPIRLLPAGLVARIYALILRKSEVAPEK